VAFPRRLDASRQDLEVQAASGALRLHEGPIDAELESIHQRRRRGVLGDVATQLSISSQIGSPSSSMTVAEYLCAPSSGRRNVLV
jgi:hypothetical protein